MFTPLTTPSPSLSVPNVGHYSAHLSRVSPVSSNQNAYVEIVEQPASIGARFRYKCEGRSAGCIRGASSTDKKKTFPAIKVCNYQGPAVVVVSCVTKDGPPYYPHPHNLVGKQTCSKGVCSMVIDSPDMTCSFPNLGIQCVKKKDVKESLMQRQAVQVDPFGTGFDHSLQPNKINLNALRLCFQVFVKHNNGTVTFPLAPVVSQPIFDNKTVSDLAITKLSHCSSSVVGGQEIILLCDQVNKDDIEVIFFEEKDGEIIWLSQAKFSPHDVHRKVAICFLTPRYGNLNVQHPVEGYIQLRRPSDGAFGKPRGFVFLPLKHDPEALLHKKHKFESLKLENIFDSGLPLVKKEECQIGVPRVIKQAVRLRNKPDCCIRGRSPTMAMLPNKEMSCQDDCRMSTSHSNEKHSNDIGIAVTASSFDIIQAREPLAVASSSATSNARNSNVQDILAIATKQIGMTLNPDNTLLSSLNVSTASALDDTLEKFDSLDLGFDPNDLDVNDVHLSDVNFDSTSEEAALTLSLENIDVKAPIENISIS